MTTILVPFDELMNKIEDLLIEQKLIRDSEFLVYADLGLIVNDKGFVSIDVQLEEDQPELQLDRDGPDVEVIEHDEP